MQPSEQPSVPTVSDTMDRRSKIVLWTAMLVGITLAGLAFAYKVAEFIFTMSGNEVQGFADVPVTVYFIVAAGWLFLLVWCWRSGKFTDIERPKFEMLEMEAEYERRGE